MPYLWQKANPNVKLRVLAAVLLVFFTLALNLIVPILFKETVTTLSKDVFTHKYIVVLLILAYGGLWTVGRFCEKFREMFLFKPINQTISKYSLEVFEHLHRLSIRFHTNKETGKITSAINRSQLAIAMVISNILFRILPVLLEVILAFAIIWYLYDISYGLLLIFILSLFFLFNIMTTKKSSQFQNSYSEAELNSSSRITDSIINSETVKFYNNENYEYKRISELLNKSSDAHVALFRGTGVFLMLQITIIAAGLAILSFKVGQEILLSQLAVGDFVLINGYLLQLFSPLNNLSFHWRDTTKNLANIKYSAMLLEDRNIIQDKADAKTLSILGPKIQFDNVSFHYDESRQILRNVSFAIEPSQMVAIVGPSGSGKSTIGRLLLRFYDLDSGRISIDSQDISEVTKKSLRDNIGVVPQDVVLLNNTLKFNLCYGSFNATEEEINKVIRLAHLDELVQKLPKGLETNVGEGGFKLSGGERQRIGIARALLKSPAILVFDEATASLDSQTEKEIQRNIEELSKRITTIVIAHRLSTIKHADHIIVLRDGEVVEEGDHQSLMKSNGLYSALWLSQSHQGGVA